jgi:uncharacterized protein with HEPN domain
VSRGRPYALERMQHMVEAADAIEVYASRGRSVFDADSTVRDAILYRITTIGEAAKAVIAADSTIETEVPDVEWSLWAKMRDRITHQYWATDSNIVWTTVTRDVPAMRAKVAAAITRLAPS